MWRRKQTDTINLGIDRLQINDGSLVLMSLAGKRFELALTDIETVVLAPAHGHWYAQTLQIVGHGTVLVAHEMPMKFAREARDFILARVAQNA